MITQDEEIEHLIKSMAYRQPIIDRVDNQTRKGIKKYGGTIEKAGHLRSGLQRLEYLAEELTDGLVYIEDLKAYIQQLEDDIKVLIYLNQADAWGQTEIDAFGMIQKRYA